MAFQIKDSLPVLEAAERNKCVVRMHDVLCEMVEYGAAARGAAVIERAGRREAVAGLFRRGLNCGAVQPGIVGPRSAATRRASPSSAWLASCRGPRHPLGTMSGAGSWGGVAAKKSCSRRSMRCSRSPLASVRRGARSLVSVGGEYEPAEDDLTGGQSQMPQLLQLIRFRVLLEDVSGNVLGAGSVRCAHHLLHAVAMFRGQEEGGRPGSDVLAGAATSSSAPQPPQLYSSGSGVESRPHKAIGRYAKA
jgi:hypothetical protein